MAKGWESKSVEEQQSEATNRSKSSKPRLTPEQIASQQSRQGLELSRQRVLQQLQAACNPNHRSTLEKALTDIDARIAALR
jgi:hypothetical protein